VTPDSVYWSGAKVPFVTTDAVVIGAGHNSLVCAARLARRGLYGCIVGRALYEGRLDLAAAVAAADGVGERGA